MKINIKEAGDYFRGLLLLIGKDKRITEAESRLLKRIGKALGFEKEFCDNAIHDILVNNYIEESPPVFTSKELAEKFIKDALFVATSDNEIHSAEMEWIKIIAKKNGIYVRWVLKEMELIQKNIKSISKLEAESLTVY